MSLLDAPTRPAPAAHRGFGVAPSRLGFGCASLGSRVDPKSGVRALIEAHEAGITWFDVAPPYGGGDAERLLGAFLKGRRETTIVTTKVGLAPPAHRRAIKLIYALGRPVAALAPSLRRAFRSMPATRNRHIPLDAALIERSIAGSLERLGTDRVDVFALHDPDPSDVVREDVLRALERVVERGQATRIAIAGGLEACRAAARVGAPYSALQTSVANLLSAGGEFEGAFAPLIVHSVFGVGGAREGLAGALEADPAKLRLLVEAGYAPDAARAAADLLLDAALALNPKGVVLTSMFERRHLAANLSRANRPLFPGAPRLLRAVLDSGEPR